MGDCEEVVENSGYVISASGCRAGVSQVGKARYELPGHWKHLVNSTEVRHKRGRVYVSRDREGAINRS